MIVSVPCRGILFFNGKYHLISVARLFSVPYRGILFFNVREGCAAVDDMNISVPYRGILFFNLYLLSPDRVSPDRRFPSPIGESYFSIEI